MSAAIHLRLAGWRVTLVEAHDRLGGRAQGFSDQGFTFDTGPTLVNYPWVFEQLFQRAGTRLADYVSLRLVSPSVECRWPSEGPLQLTSCLADLVREMERWEGSADGWAKFMSACAERFEVAFEKLVARNADSLRDWLRAVGVRTLWRVLTVRTLEGELRRYFKNRRVRDALGAYAMYLGGSPYELPGLFSIIPYGELAFGLWWPEGGVIALVNAIARLAGELGVEIVTHCTAVRIEADQSRVRGVLCENGVRIAADVVVSNVDVPTTWTRLLGRPPEVASHVRMTPGVVTVYWGIRRSLDGHPHTIFFPSEPRRCYEQLFRDRRVPDELPFYACIQSRLQPDRAPPGHTTLFVLVPVPTLRDLPEERLSSLVPTIVAQVRARLAAHGWSWSDQEMTLERVWTPADWQRRFGLYDGSAFGAAHSWRQVGPYRPRNKDPELRGMYYVGASTTPGTGLPLAILSGQMTAERIEQDFA